MAGELRGLWLGLVFLMVPVGALAQGGPPLITDDPDTPGPGYWEINLGSILQKSRSERRLDAPVADINYGVGDRIQLKFEIPWLTFRDTGESLHTGLGNAAIGVKWRFLGEEGRRVSWSVYPQLEINTGRSLAEQGFIDSGWQGFLPTELTFQFGPVEINGEVGRNFVERGDDEWIFGLSTEVEVHQRFELLAEVHGERSASAPVDLVVNVGGRQKITRQIVLLLAVGNGVSGPTDDRLHLRLFTGLQFNLPHQYTFGRSVD